MDILKSVHHCLHYLPHAGVLSSILVITVLLILGKQSLFPFACTLLLPTIVISLLFIWKRNDISLTSHTLSSTSLNSRRLMKIYGIIFCITIVYLLIVASRDGVYLFLLILLYSLAIAQVFLKDSNCFVIILELLFASLLHILTLQFCHYHYYAGGDSLVHNMYSQSIVTLGSINSELLSTYGDFAMLHITNAIASILSSMSIEAAHCISIGIPLLFISIFVFLISRNLVSSKRIAVLSVFFYLMVPIVLSYVSSASPRSLATAAFVIILYFFLKKEMHRNSIAMVFCVAILALYMILAHHAQLPLHFVVMFVLAMTYFIYNKEFSKTQKQTLILFYSIPILYYLFTYLGNMVGILKTNFFGVIASDEVSITTTTEVQSAYFGINNLLILSVSVLLLIAILLGLFYITDSRNASRKTVILWPITLFLFAVFIPGVTSAFPIFAMMEQIGRLQIILAPIFAVVMAIGLLVLGSMISKNFKYKRLPIGVMVTFCILLVIASPIISNSADSSIFEETALYSGVNAFSESEVSSFSFVEKNVESKSRIYSDFAATRHFTTADKMQFIGKTYYLFPTGTLELFTEPSYSVRENGYLLFREQHYLNNGSMTLFPYDPKKPEKSSDARNKAEGLKYDDIEYQNYLRNTHHLSSIYDSPSTEIYIT